jgi:phospholipid/cholesterol/gamma-HCH transport system substrate-binding protein
LIVSLRSILNRASGILDLIEDPNSKVGQVVQGEALYDGIRNDIASMERTVRAYGNPTGAAGRAIFGVDLYNQLRAPINDIDKQLAAIENGEGAIGHAYASSEQYDQLRGQIVDFRKLASGLENNKFLTSDEFYNNMRATLDELNTVITSMTSGPLFDNAQLYESLNGSSKSASEFLTDFRKDPRKYLRVKLF